MKSEGKHVKVWYVDVDFEAISILVVRNTYAAGAYFVAVRGDHGFDVLAISRRDANIGIVGVHAEIRFGIHRISLSPFFGASANGNQGHKGEQDCYAAL
jgi:hypothetical protein